jgi:hypothetical protein
MKRKFTGTAMQAQIKLAGIFIVIALVFGIATESCGQVWGGKPLDSYIAPNGVTYHEGDTITLYKGSARDGSFYYIKAKDEGTYGQDDGNASKIYSGKTYRIKKIKHNLRGVFFTVNLNGDPHGIWIDEAIKFCEIRPCVQVAK